MEQIGGISFDVEFTSNGKTQSPFGSGQRPDALRPAGVNTQHDRVLLVADVNSGEITSCYIDTGLTRISNLHLTHKIGNRIVLPRTDTSIQAYNNRKFGVFCSYTYENKCQLWRGGRIRSMTLWDTSGDLLRDYIPVRVGTVGYLYDRANPTGGPLGNGLYGSATDTPFIAGPDVVAV